MKKTISFLAILLALVACDNSSLIENDLPLIRPQIYVMPQGSSTPLLFIVQDSSYREVNVPYTFQLGITSNGILQEDPSKLYASVLWKIDDANFNIASFNYSFRTPGIKECSLTVVDAYGDTLVTNFSILVNTPNKIHLSSPSNMSNQVDKNSSVVLQWTTEGIDPWETANCSVFASEEPDDVWNNKLGTVDCSKEVKLGGFGDENKLSNTIYWGVAMEVSTPGGNVQRDSSKIFNFSTKLTNSKFSLLTIPILFENSYNRANFSTKICLTNTNGDTLRKFSNMDNSITINTFVVAQSGIHISAQEQQYIEYTADIQVIDVPESTAVLADTIRFVDRTAPQIAPAQDEYDNSTALHFYVYDRGSGVNPNSLRTIIGNDTIQHSFELYLLRIPHRCLTNCKVFIDGADYAGNRLPDNYWIVSNTQSGIEINGPYAREEE